MDDGQEHMRDMSQSMPEFYFCRRADRQPAARIEQARSAGVACRCGDGRSPARRHSAASPGAPARKSSTCPSSAHRTCYRTRPERRGLQRCSSCVARQTLGNDAERRRHRTQIGGSSLVSLDRLSFGIQECPMQPRASDGCMAAIRPRQRLYSSLQLRTASQAARSIGSMPPAMSWAIPPVRMTGDISNVSRHSTRPADSDILRRAQLGAAHYGRASGRVVDPDGDGGARDHDQPAEIEPEGREAACGRSQAKGGPSLRRYAAGKAGRARIARPRPAGPHPRRRWPSSGTSVRWHERGCPRMSGRAWRSGARRWPVSQMPLPTAHALRPMRCMSSD